MEELALRPKRLRGRIRSPATGFPVASRCARIWCVRPVSSRTRSNGAFERRRSKCDGVAGCRCRESGQAAVALERRVDRSLRAGGRPRRVPGTRASAGARAAAGARRASSSRASTSRPDVSRSSLCTTPGSGRPPATAASACTSVPRPWPWPGWTTTPRACRRRSGGRPRWRSRTARPGPRRGCLDSASTALSRLREHVALRLRRPSTRTSRRRSAAGRRCASPRARRGDLTCLSTATPTRDGDVGDVEGRPVRELDEVRHRAGPTGRSGCRRRRRAAAGRQPHDGPSGA